MQTLMMENLNTSKHWKTEQFGFYREHKRNAFKKGFHSYFFYTNKIIRKYIPGTGIAYKDRFKSANTFHIQDFK